MLTYRDVFRVPQFGPLFATSALQSAASTTSQLALGVLVFARTGSPLLSALSMFGSSLAQLIGATLLMSAADRLPPRGALGGAALAFGAGTAVLAVPGLPLPLVFAVVLGEGVLAAVIGGVRYGLLHEVLPKEGFLLGRSVLSMCAGTMQICGYAAGGVLVAVASPRGTLLVAAALYVAGAAAARFGLARRPPRAAGRPSVAETWRTNALLWSSAPRRRVYLLLWVPNGLVVGCESLFVPYRPDRAGLLFACAAFGMLAGDTVTGRFVPARWRGRLGTPLLLLLATPYLLFALRPALPLALLLTVLASTGFSASLLFQERLMALTPDAMTGHALGLHSSGMLAAQGVTATLAGAVAQHSSPSTAIAVMAAASVAVTLTTAPALRARDGIRTRTNG
ncbi:MFS transporter [Streptomyces sp. NBC_00059]|uniref:MFS transporter n=1 Tax=Streptomyces sp. NBC_00059 TaxID=2975635 RepID=UPI002259FCFB|nr:MFS transporter [Streptomyces sp. NBC_00059]MCX5412586.1 MFS transporter [Streptomyces sp. NBC_00059]